MSAATTEKKLRGQWTGTECNKKTYARNRKNILADSCTRKRREHAVYANS